MIPNFFVGSCIVFLTLLDVTSSLSSSSSTPAIAPSTRLKTLLSKPGCNLMPGCYDGLSARLIQTHESNFKIAFMTGFGAAASRGYPDLGLLSSGDVMENARSVTESMRMAAAETNKDLIPCIVDGDTGYGGSAIVRRTILNFGAAGVAGVLIEDQAAASEGGMKRCGHVDGKDVVSFEDALERVKVAVAARDEFKALTGTDGPLILARTDARGSKTFQNNGLEEGIRRCKAFRDVGADITFLESPQNVDEMMEYCDKVEGPKMANLIEGGKTPILTLKDLDKMGYSIAVYPLSLLSAATKAMNKVLDAQAVGSKGYEDDLLQFQELKRSVGFDAYL
mmetsp:Transcript_12021/g.13586  ORF Transcript_12021/g.13586 Transcript_12021/m.13586 type:complete len:337 (+) Transcript_12021:140-1150(+)